MSSYEEMTMVKKEQGQNDYFSQQSILLTLPANISLLAISGTYVLCRLVKYEKCAKFE